MYFASDMAGTKGYSDIYKVKRNSDGSFGSPENLGSEINTTGRESFPSVDKDGNLYFASDGHLGLGGLDLFKAKINADGSFEKPKNLEKKSIVQKTILLLLFTIKHPVFLLPTEIMEKALMTFIISTKNYANKKLTELCTMHKPNNLFQQRL